MNLQFSAFSLFCNFLAGCACKIDQKEAIYYANRLGRAVQYFSRNCMDKFIAFSKIDNPPPASVIVKLLHSLCAPGEQCSEELKTFELKPLMECQRPRLWAMWGDYEGLNMEQKKFAEATIDCAAEGVEDVKVGWLLISYGLKLLG
ncbi:uncharacterized protein LOC144145266 [Haemaphysalis longicornis]